jgi:uncharacterized paraquat-inducible protein A
MRIVDIHATKPELLVIECDCTCCFPHLASKDEIECPVCHKLGSLNKLQEVCRD